jgi:hypothetical protein
MASASRTRSPAWRPPRRCRTSPSGTGIATTAVIARRDESPDPDDNGAWFAWTIPARGEHDTPGYLRAVALCRGGRPSLDDIHEALDGASPFGSQGSVYRLATQRWRTTREPAAGGFTSGADMVEAFYAK